MDCGLDYSKVKVLFNKSIGTAGSNLQKYEGSFEKTVGQRGTVKFDPLIADPTARISGRDEVTEAQGDDGGTMAEEQRTSPAFLEKGLRAMVEQTESTGMES